jgi:hypothetical protein
LRAPRRPMPSGWAMVARAARGSSVSGDTAVILVEQLRPGQLGVVRIDDLELPSDDLAEPSRPIRLHRPGSGRPGRLPLLTVRDLRGQLAEQARLCPLPPGRSRSRGGTALAGDPIEQRRQQADSSSRPINGDAARVPRFPVPDEQPRPPTLTRARPAPSTSWVELPYSPSRGKPVVIS